MSKIIAIDDLRDNAWNILEKDVSSHYADLQIGFTKDAPVVPFDNLRFGFALVKDGEMIDSKNWPPENIRYRRTDQKYLITHRLRFEPETEYSINIWAENAGIRAETTHTFTTPRPPQPYESWTWDGEQWNPPVEYPDDGGDYVWDEGAQAWVEFDEGSE